MVETTNRDGEHILAQLADRGGEHQIAMVDRVERSTTSTLGHHDGEAVKAGILVEDRSPNNQQVHRVYRTGPYTVHYEEWNDPKDGRVASVRVEREDVGEREVD